MSHQGGDQKLGAKKLEAGNQLRPPVYTQCCIKHLNGIGCSRPDSTTTCLENYFTVSRILGAINRRPSLTRRLLFEALRNNYAKMDVDNLVKLFEAMHISDQPPGSSISGDVVIVDRPTSPMLSTMPDDDQLWVSSVPRVVGAEVSETPGIISRHSAPIGPESHETLKKIKGLAQKLLTNDTASRLICDSKIALQDWLHLLELTTLPAEIASSDPAVATRLGHLDSMIVGNHGKLIARLAHIQFLRVIETLEAIIAKERSSGFIEQRKDRESTKNAAYRKYREASTRPVGAQQLYNLKRYCKRYQTLAGSSPLFILAYTDKVDIVV